MEVADPLPQDSSIRRGDTIDYSCSVICRKVKHYICVCTGSCFAGATFYNGQCASGQIFETLVCRPAECGVQSVDPEASSRTFIVNGKDAQNGAWPWQISLQVRVSDKQCIQTCTCNLINTMSGTCTCTLHTCTCTCVFT